jgi:hypothetical protein
MVLGALKNQSLPNEYRQTSINISMAFLKHFRSVLPIIFLFVAKKKMGGHLG